MKHLSALLTVMLCITIIAYGRGVGSSNVKFGKPDEKTSKCYGKGICMLTNISSMQGTINVSFELLPELGGSRDLVMLFNINDLRITDPEQALLFVNSAGQAMPNYNMDYTFTNQELCNELGIAPGDLIIQSTDQNVIELLTSSQVRVTYRIPSRR